MSEAQAIEDKARAQGWVPKEEFRGGEENHKTAEEFLEVGDKISGIQKERNDKLLNEVMALNKKVEGYQTQMIDFKQTHMQQVAEAKQKAYDKAILDLKEKQLVAASEADVNEVKKIQEQIDDVKKPEPVKVEGPETKELPKEFVSWQEKNDWYGKDKELTEWAEFVGSRLNNDGINRTPSAWYSEIETRVKEKYPGKFKTNKETPDVEASSQGGNVGKPSGGYKYKDLPEDAKKACDKYVNMGLYKDKAAYVKEYYGE